MRPGSSFTNYHPKFLGFEVTLRKMRDNMSSTVTSVARIGLPITVQSFIEHQNKHNLAWLDNNTKMVYIDLKGTVNDDYSVIKDTADFEEF